MDIKKNATLIAPLLLLGLVYSTVLPAQDEQSADNKDKATPSKAINIEQTTTQGLYTDEGADTCIRCHDEDEAYPVFDIFKTPHGQQGDKLSPFAGLQCEACHGPGIAGVEFMEEALERGGHVGRVRPGQERPPILNFGDKSDEPVEQQNSMCLNCHADKEHIAWKGSIHEDAGVACANCHQVHTAHDPVLTRDTQPDVCYKCHKEKRTDFLKPSTHPVRFGQMACTDCHITHGSVAAGSLMLKPTLNQTCYTCHAEKRGPLLWEHAPVAEDCSLCHTPHGSIHNALLTRRTPLLCQQCHSQAGHPSVELTGSRLPSGNPSSLLLSGGCINCHTQVHGSNHPSGVKLMR